MRSAAETQRQQRTRKVECRYNRARLRHVQWKFSAFLVKDIVLARRNKIP
jgi:hypothetical protein